MAQRKKLLEVNYHYDSDTGIYKIGEVDFGIHGGLLEDYLKRYGLKGRNEIVKTLGYLIHKVFEVHSEVNKPEGGYGATQTRNAVTIE